MYTVDIAESRESFRAAADDSILSAALRAGQSIPYECNSGGCGACKFDLLGGEIQELWPDAPGLTERDKRKGKHLACQCRAISDIEIKLTNRGEFQSLFPPQKFTAETMTKEILSAEMFRLVLNAPAPIQFVPGQYFMITLPELGSRAYSVANPVDGNKLTFIIKSVPGGKISNALAYNLPCTLALDGPYGVTGLTSTDEQQSVFIAGGSGIAPMVSMVTTLINQGYKKPITVFYGSRLEDELTACDRLFPKAGNLQLIKVLSAVDEHSDWRGKTGFIHESISEVLTDFTMSEFYLCGPPPMISAVQKLLMHEKGVAFERIHYDRFF
ncbi:2Fe-2S iron-sulfur cluster binding domain-containing protein [Alteromonas antoniana]|jgi:toluene monooxygenase electron transfer component|uniref:2Fe-2S iron-sulfur cluster binding domain-containing protein n=1 Tax=Alteromonas antoniana TaxID=2803813 RepID=UPI001C48AE43|nr:2Fe-2S iron-sulfur cluster binding domain-containing protein [Alteromonas antoniana]